eukprot:scaffold4452_cov40-Cyclotella_meneghiniana.AAC.4
MTALQIITQTDNRRVGGDVDAVAMLYDVYDWFYGVITERSVMVVGANACVGRFFSKTESALNTKHVSYLLIDTI